MVPARLNYLLDCLLGDIGTEQRTICIWILPDKLMTNRTDEGHLVTTLTGQGGRGKVKNES